MGDFKDFVKQKTKGQISKGVQEALKNSIEELIQSYNIVSSGQDTSESGQEYHKLEQTMDIIVKYLNAYLSDETDMGNFNLVLVPKKTLTIPKHKSHFTMQ